ncbi:hypothetical protein PHYBOEH_008964, partial [Phytophthora boehmeriae]
MCAAFDRKAERARTISDYKATINIMKVDSEEHASDIDTAKHVLKQLDAENKLMVRRSRKYRLFSTAEQRKRLRRFMGTCRWTYNQAVAAFRKTNELKIGSLRDLYVTQATTNKREYPKDMRSPPEWLFETPIFFRYNTLRKFQSNVKSAFSNKLNGNIAKFTIHFKSKKDSRLFTFCEGAKDAKTTHTAGESRALLSISKMADIPIRCDPGLSISSKIQVTNSNGF